MRYSDMPPFSVVHKRAGEAYDIPSMGCAVSVLRDDAVREEEAAADSPERWVLVQQTSGDRLRMAYPNSFFESLEKVRRPDLDSSPVGSFEIRGVDCNSQYASPRTGEKVRVVGDFRAPTEGCSFICYESTLEGGERVRLLSREASFFGKEDWPDGSVRYRFEMRLRG